MIWLYDLFQTIQHHILMLVGILATLFLLYTVAFAIYCVVYAFVQVMIIERFRAWRQE
ncbi:hypothetical protein LCGC14_0970540 [marine sediment metagenome]|uniref:Uncharacterized protein n=1 Tax=marine sediment metagenome TaxID=412755 RepID=A0A0F9NGA4_9ZZZZ